MKCNNVLAFLAPFVFVGCGLSPALNHTNADDLPARANTTANAECPISFSRAKLCASLVWDKEPSEEEGVFTLKFCKQGSDSKVLVNPLNSVAVQLWMPDMGHGSSPVTISHVGTGVFSVTKVYFVMPGAWDIRIQLKEGSKIVEQAIWKETIH